MKKHIDDETYRLNLYDHPVLEFKFLTQGFERGNVEILNVYEKNMLPYGLNADNDELKSWLTYRSVPKNREFIREFLKSMGLDERDVKGIIDVSKGLSLNDAYWICKNSEQLKFDDINLYDNDFSEALSLVAFTGHDTKIAQLMSSPEFTTTGMLAKCWRRINGETYLYKGGTSGYANAGNEPYSEYYASQIVQKLDYSHVDYQLEKWKGILASTCKIFTSKDISYVPAGYIVSKGGLAAVDKYIKNLNDPIIYRDFKRMILFDAIIYNKDRHFGNFGFMVNSIDKKVIGFNPIFDNGAGLFAYALEDEATDINKLSKYAKQNSYSYHGISLDDMVKTACTREMATDLHKLIDFKFKRHPLYNLSEKRLQTIEQFINERVIKLLRIVEKCSS